MLAYSNLESRGDTLIEVLFAISVFSLVAVGGLAIMNQGTATSQRALEITLVRQEIDAQAETLRFLNTSYVAAYQQGITDASNIPAKQWSIMSSSIKETNNENVPPFGVDGVKCPEHSKGSFILNTRSATFIGPDDKLDPAQIFSKVNYDSGDVVTSAQGIWIEAVRWFTDDDSNHQKNSAYIDFHIRACWDSPGQSIPVTIGTIVRLYEPRG